MRVGRELLRRELEREGPPTRARARAFYRLGDIAGWQGDLDAADEALNQAASLAQQTADDEILVEVLSNIAWVAHNRGEHDRAAELALEAITLAERAGSERRIADLKSLLGSVAVALGKFDEAHSLLAESLVFLQQIGEPVNVATGHINLADLEIEREDYTSAREHAETDLLPAGVDSSGRLFL